MNAALVVQQVIWETLVANPALLTALGGADVYDDIPPAAKLPWIVFDRIETEDWSTGTEEGGEHRITLSAWSGAEGRKQAQHLAGLAVAALCAPGAALAVPLLRDGQQIVSFSHETTTAERDRDSGFYRSQFVFRAVTEPVA